MQVSRLLLASLSRERVQPNWLRHRTLTDRQRRRVRKFIPREKISMSTDTRADALERRIQNLYASDPQFAAARPDEAVSAAIERPGLRLPQLVQTVMDGYANRPALGQRAVQLVKDPDTGRTTAELLPRFETITYRRLWQRAGAIASAWANKPVRPGDRVCVYWVSPAWTTPSSMWR